MHVPVKVPEESNTDVHEGSLPLLLFSWSSFVLIFTALLSKANVRENSRQANA